MKQLFLGLLFVLFAYPEYTFAHNFKLDSYGCHNNGALNVYECHDGVMKGKSWPNPDGKTKMLVELNTPPPPPAPLPCIPPPPPVAKIGRDSSGVLLTWDPVPPMEETVTYEIAFYARDIKDTPLPQAEIDRISVIVPTGVHTVVFLGSIMPETGYWFRVRAIHKQAYGPWSDSAYFKGLP